MYNITSKLFTLFFILVSINIYSQCTESGFDFGNNTSTTSYNVFGDVSVTLNTDNTVTLDLGSDFSTANGPDVRAYLLDSDGMTDLQINQEVHDNRENKLSAFNTIPFGEVSANGAQTFTINIPDGQDIASYDKILFYCLQFSQFWDIGSFNAFTSSNCSVLSTEENAFSNVNISPNPASTTLQLSNIDSDNAEIRIFDFSGKKVFQQLKGDNQNTIDISHLNSGIYVLSIIENNKQFSKKLVIQQ